MAATLKPATSLQLEQARSVYRTDWDAQGVTTLSIPDHIAEALLEARGWKMQTHVRSADRTLPTYTSYIAPDGTRSWHLDEALRLALTAEVAE